MQKTIDGINIDYKSETKDTAAYFYLAADIDDATSWRHSCHGSYYGRRR